MKEERILERVKFKISHQGAVVVNQAVIYQKGELVVAISCDMRTKRAYMSATGSNGDTPCVTLDENEHTLHKHRTKKGFTEIEFPDYVGWSIHCASVSKYTLDVCLVRPHHQQDEREDKEIY